MKTFLSLLERSWLVLLTLAFVGAGLYMTVYPFYHCGFWEVVFYGKNAFWAALFGVCSG